MAAIVDLARYRALVRAIGGVLAALIAIDLVLRLVFGFAPPALVRASFHDSHNRELVASRTSAVIAEHPAQPIAVIVGASSAYDGMIPAVLDGADPAHRRWLNLAATGSSFDELRYTFAPLFASGLAADLVVVAVHPSWLAGRVVGDPMLDALMLPDAPRTSWLLYHRGLVNHAIRDELASAHASLLVEQLGVPFDSVYPPAADPWTTHRRTIGDRDPDRRDQMELWRRKRWFDASWYARSDDEPNAAADVIAASKRTGKRVVIVFMPESSTLRAAVPAEAEAAFHRALARVPAPPVVIDLRAAIPDDRFLDHIHLDEAGARLLSTTLASRL
jgi:hypothetical protein